MLKRSVSSLLRKPAFSITFLGLAVNSLLCALKLTVGLWTSSLALISDGVNSLTDAVSSLAIMIAVHASHKEADEGHPFGHRRAEPIASLILAIFAGIAGFEILKAGIGRLYTPADVQIAGVLPFAVLGFSMLVKSGMTLLFYRVGHRMHSPAILAGAADSQIDILISAAAMGAVAAAYLGLQIIDPIVALLISGFIFRTGYKVGKENIDYLMGRSPGEEALEEILSLVQSIPGVEAVDDLKAHYVGHYIHVAVEILVSREMSISESHDLEESVERALEELSWIDKAFVHVNPFAVRKEKGPLPES